MGGTRTTDQDWLGYEVFVTYRVLVTAKDRANAAKRAIDKTGRHEGEDDVSFISAEVHDVNA
jgi:hypothetical protein